jgi:hypothetical protein
VERNEDRSVGVTGSEVTLDAHLVAATLGHEEDERQLLLGEGVADTAQDAREERVAEELGGRLGNDDRDGVAASRDQAASGTVGRVAELAHRGLDRRSRRLGNATIAVDDARGGGPRNVGGLRHLLECRRARPKLAPHL